MKTHQMKVKLKNTYSLHDLNFDCIFFENLKENYEEMEICMYEDVFLDLNTHTTITSLLEKYSLHYFVCGLSYFGVEKELEKLSTYLQRKKTEDFFEKHIDKVDWRHLSENSSLSEAFFEKHINKVDWRPLSKNSSLSEAFFEKHIDKVNWWYISWNPSLSEAFFEKHIDKVDWNCLSENPSLSEAFCEKHIDTVYWRSLSGNPSLSEAFFEKHIDKVEWWHLSGNNFRIKPWQELFENLS